MFGLESNCREEEAPELAGQQLPYQPASPCGEEILNPGTCPWLCLSPWRIVDSGARKPGSKQRMSALVLTPHMLGFM